MNDLPRHTLSRIIAEHGRALCDSPKRVEALLRDLCGAQRREINIIIGALDERVAADLMAAGKSVPRDVLLARLAARLRDNLAYTPEAARWGVETWAVALGVLSEAELRARAEAADEDGRGNAPPAVQQPKPPPPPPPPPPHPAGTGPQAARPQSSTTQTPARQPSQPSQPSRPSKTNSPTPPARRVPSGPAPRGSSAPGVPVPGPPRQNVSPSLPSRPTPRRRGLTLRGCLIAVVLVVLLVVAAVFVVPAVVMLLQEEQTKPSINEPRIR